MGLKKIIFGQNLVQKKFVGQKSFFRSFLAKKNVFWKKIPKKSIFCPIFGWLWLKMHKVGMGPKWGWIFFSVKIRYNFFLAKNHFFSRFWRIFFWNFPKKVHFLPDFGPPGPRKSLSPLASMGHLPLRKPPWEKFFLSSLSGLGGQKWPVVVHTTNFGPDFFFEKFWLFPKISTFSPILGPPVAENR